MHKAKERGSYASPLGNLRAKVLKVFGRNMGFELSHAGHEIAFEGNNHYYLQGEAKSALLDSECIKATAITEYQRQKQQRFC